MPCMCGAWDCRSCHPGQPRVERAEPEDDDTDIDARAARDEADGHDVRMRMYDRMP